MDRLLNTDTFYEGITIDGLSMDGLTKESAEKSLRKLNQPRLDKLDIELKYESNTWTFGHEDIQAYIDIAEKVDEAYSVARKEPFRPVPGSPKTEEARTNLQHGTDL